jgi:hypothetical protein
VTGKLHASGVPAAPAINVLTRLIFSEAAMASAWRELPSRQNLPAA